MPQLINSHRCDEEAQAVHGGSQQGRDDRKHTAKLHGIDPQTYLADVLDRIVSGRTKVNVLRELLPWEWKAAREAAAA